MSSGNEFSAVILGRDVVRMSYWELTRMQAPDHEGRGTRVQPESGNNFQAVISCSWYATSRVANVVVEKHSHYALPIVSLYAHNHDSGRRSVNTFVSTCQLTFLLDGTHNRAQPYDSWRIQGRIHHCKVTKFHISTTWCFIVLAVYGPDGAWSWHSQDHAPPGPRTARTSH